MFDETLLHAHVGRAEIRNDVADPERLLRLAALLDRPWTAADGMPPLGHFLLFRPDDCQSRLGEDGHPMRDETGMLPPLPLPRRMWAGSRIRFAQPIPVGAPLVRRSRLVSAKVKIGNSGPMVFCTVEHRILQLAGEDLLILEEQDIVYRAADGTSAPPTAAVINPPFTPDHSRNLRADPIMLFRYSALTFNSHRIHYDRDYARGVEGYSGLVVHGPLLATLLFDHLVHCAGGRWVTEFNFRAVSPAFDSDDLTLGMRAEGDVAELSVVGPAGLVMKGTARLCDPAAR
jgi:3-methylfumaryl-CoA hydratase